MTAAEEAWPAVAAPGSGRPTLFAVAGCDCGERVVEVRDRAGRSVRLVLGSDGKALRDAAGVWWPVQVAGQWRVRRAEESVVAPPGAPRYAGHQCRPVDAGAASQTADGVPVDLAEPDVAVVRTGNGRPPGRGTGLDGSPCPERRTLPQATPEGQRPAGRMCMKCGRVTARADFDGLAWCGGTMAVAASGGAR